MIKIVIKLGKHELKVSEEPDLMIDEEKGIMSIIVVVQDKDGTMYELHYMTTLDDPDLIIYHKGNTFTFLDEIK